MDSPVQTFLTQAQISPTFQERYCMLCLSCNLHHNLRHKQAIFDRFHFKSPVETMTPRRKRGKNMT